MRAIYLTLSVLILGVTTLPALPNEPVLIPRSMPGDKGKYYILEATRDGEVVSMLHMRAAPDGSVGYTRLETNCRTMLMREMGYAEGSPGRIRIAPSDWFELVPGSSKSDLAHFVCK